MIPVWTFNRNTGLEISRTEKKVRFIPLDVTELMRVHETSVAKFDSEWQPIPGYDPEKAVAHFKRIGTQYGALKEVRQLLGITYVPRAETEEPKKPSPTVEAVKPPVKKKLSRGARFIELIMNPPPSLGEIPSGRKPNKTSVQVTKPVVRNTRKVKQSKAQIVERLRSIKRALTTPLRRNKCSEEKKKTR